MSAHPYDIGRPKTLEIGAPKCYSKRKTWASFKVDPELWSGFKRVCAERGVSICHVLEALMEAWIQGQRAEATLVRPVIVNLTMQHVVERPRRMARIQDVVYESKLKNWPPGCQDADEFWKGPKEVGCRKLKDLIALDKCWRCYLTNPEDPNPGEWKMRGP